MKSVGDRTTRLNRKEEAKNGERQGNKGAERDKGRSVKSMGGAISRRERISRGRQGGQSETGVCQRPRDKNASCKRHIHRKHLCLDILYRLAVCTYTMWIYAANIVEVRTSYCHETNKHKSTEPSVGKVRTQNAAYVSELFLTIKSLRYHRVSTQTAGKLAFDCTPKERSSANCSICASCLPWTAMG